MKITQQTNLTGNVNPSSIDFFVNPFITLLRKKLTAIIM